MKIINSYTGCKKEDIMTMPEKELREAVVRIFSLDTELSSDRDGWQGAVLLPDDIADAFRSKFPIDESNEVDIVETSKTFAMSKFTSSYYTGAVEAYERELNKAKEAGVIFKHDRLEQFKMMLEDFKTIETELNTIKGAQ
jgi:hypothetical protein